MTALLDSAFKGNRWLEVRIQSRAARFDLHGMRQQVVRLAGGAVQGPATRAGGGPNTWACRGHLHWGHLLALYIPQGKQCISNCFQSACLTVGEKCGC